MSITSEVLTSTQRQLVSTKVLTMVLDMYRDPGRMVDDISSVGLRQVVYTSSADTSARLGSAIVEVISDYSSGETGTDGCKWTHGLIICTGIRTSTGGPRVKKVINTNAKKSCPKLVRKGLHQPSGNLSRQRCSRWSWTYIGIPFV